MSNVLGIDLGASYAKAVFIEEGRDLLRPVSNTNLDCLFRVCGMQDAQGTFLAITDDEERQRAMERGMRLSENVKSLRGDDTRGEELEIAVLRVILERYRDLSGDFDLGKLKRVVLAHPVSHRPAAVEALLRIAVTAGIPKDLIDTIEEPVALGLFATRLQTNFSGRLLVIDAGHYSTDFVLINLDDGRPNICATNYLGLRCGVAELIHAVARSAWLKCQMAAGVTQPSEGPFQQAGPETDDPLVRRLSAWAESKVLRALGFGMFSRDASAALRIKTIANDFSLGPWSDKVHVVHYFYDLGCAEKEQLARSYPHHTDSLDGQIVRENYRDVTRAATYSVCAALVGVLAEVDELAETQVVFGGGLSLIPEVRNAIVNVLQKHGLPPPLSMEYCYDGIGSLSVGRLLGVASGAALDATRRFTRRDTLSDTVGMLMFYELEEALQQLDEAGNLGPDFEPDEATLEKMGTRKLANGVLILPLHKIIAMRESELPLSIQFPDHLVALSRGATLSVTRCGDPNGDCATVESAMQPRGGVVARIRIPETVQAGTTLRLSLAIDRNDVWRLSVTDAAGIVIVESTVAIEFASRGDRHAPLV